MTINAVSVMDYPEITVLQDNSSGTGAIAGIAIAGISIVGTE